MPQDHVLVIIDHVLINAAFITSVLFVPVTSAYWPWWQSWWGRNIVILELCIAGTLLGSWLFLDFGISSVAFQWIAAFFLTAIVGIIVWRAVMIWFEQRKGAREHSDYPNPRHEDRLPSDSPRELSCRLRGVLDQEPVPGDDLRDDPAVPDDLQVALLADVPAVSVEDAGTGHAQFRAGRALHADHQPSSSLAEPGGVMHAGKRQWSLQAESRSPQIAGIRAAYLIKVSWSSGRPLAGGG